MVSSSRCDRLAHDRPAVLDRYENTDVMPIDPLVDRRTADSKSFGARRTRPAGSTPIVIRSRVPEAVGSSLQSSVIADSPGVLDLTIAKVRRLVLVPDQKSLLDVRETNPYGAK